MKMDLHKKNPKITILGAGSWGITISILLHEKGFHVTLWEFFSKKVELLQKYHEDRKCLPGIKISKNIDITSNMADAVKDADIIIVALPSHFVREHMKRMASLKINPHVIVSLTKGIENETFSRMSEVITDCLGRHFSRKVVTLSGPSHAEEVSRKYPTAIVVSGKDDKLSEEIQLLFMNDYFRPYTNPDQIGVELGGSLKNIIAIACGIADGLGFGDNTKAALITRGLAEISRLGVILGAKPITFMGLAGLGDLVVTCTSQHSRNRKLGNMIGQGDTLDEALSKMVMVAEGVETTKSAFNLSQRHKVEMPITEKVYKILFENQPPIEAVKDLLKRKHKSEMGEEWLTEYKFVKL